MPKTKPLVKRREFIDAPPRWIEPQLCKLDAHAPTGVQWVHEVKFDGYRMAARIDRGHVQLLTRSGLDWTAKYPETAKAIAALPVKTAYLDGELCGVRGDGVTSFELIQQATDSGTGSLVYFAFDLIEVDGEDIAKQPLLVRKARLAKLLKKAPAGVTYSEHEGGNGEVFRKAACIHGLEGIVSKRSSSAASTARPARRSRARPWRGGRRSISIPSSTRDRKAIP
jgi:ATP-dependent DNA ligase